MRGAGLSVSMDVNDDGIAVVDVAAQVIINIVDTQIMKKVKEHIQNTDTPRMVLDLTRVGYLDSFSFTSIIKVRSQLREKNGELAICCPNEDVLYLFELTNFLKAVPVYRDKDKAVAALALGNHEGRVVNY